MNLGLKIKRLPVEAVEHLADVVVDLTNRDVAIFGLSFKPHTEDIREAPAKIIINELLSRHANVHCWDPKAEPSMVLEFPPSVIMTRLSIPLITLILLLLLLIGLN